LRVENPQNSTLPDQLPELGFQLQHCGVSTRTSVGFIPVDCYAFTIPLGK
jgi:hypothetical protein